MIGIGVGIPHSKGIQRFKYLLDEDFAQGATAAYALRLLREKHSGGIIRCRADDQGTSKGEADVLPILQPDGSKIITLNSPIENFSGTPFSGDNYVLADLVDAGNNNYNGLTSSWYDQSGNLNDAIQSTASNQPALVDSGSVIQENSKPALQFDGSSTVLIANTNNITYSALSWFIVTSVDFTGDGSFRIIAQTINSNADVDITRNIIHSHNKINTNIQAFVTGGAGRLYTYSLPDKKQFLNTYTANSNVPFIKDFLNGAKQKEDLNTTFGTTINKLKIGEGDNNEFKGNFSEAIIYYSDKLSERNNIETNINNHYTIF